MFVSTITVICYYNGQILRTETYVKYKRRKAGNCAFGCTS